MLTVKDARIESTTFSAIELTVTFEIEISRPRVESTFEVETRGRVYKMETVKHGANSFAITYVFPQVGVSQRVGVRKTN
jgi:hypothetical protein